jgi:hypothetical protein
MSRCAAARARQIEGAFASLADGPFDGKRMIFGGFTSFVEA